LLVSAAIPLAKLAGDVFTASYVGDAIFSDKIKRKSNSADIERREAVQKTKPHIVLLQLTLFYRRRNNRETGQTIIYYPIIASLDYTP
jgi:hypothetical protein